jgi:FkbM family methyltransferase
MYKDLDFLEIGTSDFDTLLQSAPDELIGMSVEPIKKYLDNLPAKANVTKVNAAIKAKNRDETCQVYYIPDNVIDDHSLPSFLKGCNSINEYHLQHNLLNLQPMVIQDTIPQVSISTLLEQHNIRKIGYLKIDSEGGDCYILNDLIAYLSDKDQVYYPQKILFESNELSDSKMVDDVIQTFCNMGYRLVYRGGDTLLQI